MFPLDPIGGDRPDTRRQPRRDDPPPNDGNDGNKALWILGIMAGALGIFAVVSAI